ncbi:MAG: 3-hydroxyacyl-CoA dehydrogenase [Sulfobacillus acidophilus]|uniref:3-hydroxyacyl-CoA dehydrogenase n=1 Tax=Sulfobacillus acidophilus TaxID=53633 RepID=A0A2T2WK44_9FIRM|nr:MAG: 3-hydroxyacyl-CoA dehydrogenase [Sulfobacillus acidophilus]
MDANVEQQLILRFSLATFLESVRLYEEGIASVEDIDIAMRAGAGLPQGPFQWADTRGLDVVLQDLEQLAKTLGPRFSPPQSLQDLVARGWVGKASGQGYLSHS